MDCPKFTLIEIVTATGGDTLTGERPVIAECNHCGAELVAKCFVVKNNETGDVLSLGSSCVKKYTGYTARQIRQQNDDYQVEIECQTALKVKIKEFYQLNKYWVDYLEKIAEKSDFWFSLLENYKRYGSLTSNMLGIIKCDYVKKRSQKKFAGRIELQNAVVLTLKEDFSSEYGSFFTVRLLCKQHIFKAKIWNSNKLFEKFADNIKIGNKISVKASVKNTYNNETTINRLIEV